MSETFLALPQAEVSHLVIVSHEQHKSLYMHEHTHTKIRNKTTQYCSHLFVGAVKSL